MSTPEEQAETIVHNIPDWHPSSYDDVVELRAHITRAIRDAYERAAEVALSDSQAYYYGIFGSGENEAVKVAADIAARIRALKGEG